MAILKNLARMSAASSGTGTITLSAATSGFLTFNQAGCSTAAAGSAVGYAINDIGISEIGRGTYISTSLTLTRGPLTTTSGGAAINLSSSTAQIFLQLSANDFQATPTVTTFTSSATGTYTAPSNAVWLEILCVGGGGGGGCANSTTASASGATTTFGPLTANGGAAGVAIGGAGGTASGGNLFNVTGGGGGATRRPSTGLSAPCAPGGDSYFRGAGRPIFSAAGGAGASGGGGASGSLSSASGSASVAGGGGGGACGHFVAVASSGASYSYTVGGGGAGAITAATSVSFSGGKGGTGLIIVKEFYLG